MDKNTQFSSFAQWLQPINFQQLDQMVEEKQSDKYVKKLTPISYFSYTPIFSKKTVCFRSQLLF
ncbi:MAG: hypothetical protein K0S25_124 [Bacillus sp. (in: firmicutes)]|jgi:hypothetical protein|nr:hypothetical protein [Bacillus sp. (in: firmicutes)]